MKKSMIIAFALMLQAAVVNIAFAQKPEIMVSDKKGWHKIGEVTASFKMDKESIAVLGADKFKAIKLKVTDAPINIENATVKYESGQVQEIPVSKELSTGEETQVFDLNRPTDDIKDIIFTYKTIANVNKDKAHVEVYGLK